MTRSALSPPRQSFGFLNVHDKALVMGGNDGKGNYFNDIWMSTNGTVWASLKPAEWTPRSRYSLLMARDSHSTSATRSFRHVVLPGSKNLRCVFECSVASVVHQGSVYILAGYGPLRSAVRSVALDDVMLLCVLAFARTCSGYVWDVLPRSILRGAPLHLTIIPSPSLHLPRARQRSSFFAPLPSNICTSFTHQDIIIAPPH